ncbi:MAG: hypothetical protein KatS3mg098_299 [Candidatus Parcubacteria bacterium]|nr:ribonuclease H-like domain-containing protein [Patescibacteria group bacterium]BCX16070.1 MAG: hypothetical protein KatS3mg098_299 [Candidatus Parcubacteria bacterium]
MESKKLVFDIETAGKEFESLDVISQDFMLKYAESDEEEERVKEGTSFYPLTGEVVAIGVLNPDSGQGAVFVQSEDKNLPSILEEGISLEKGSEKEILEKFWEVAKFYNVFISFNGRRFDIPFLMIRSAILGVKPSKNLLANRYLSSQPQEAKHIDLFDQLSFYGASRKNFPLHMWTKAFGIKSPKEDGISGNDITALYREGKILEIAKYNLEDLKSTAELYRFWEKYLNFNN